MVAVYRVGLKTKPHLKNSVSRIFHNGAMVLLEFRFARVLGSLPTTQDGLQGWMEYATPALQVVIVPYQLGSTRELGTV